MNSKTLKRQRELKQKLMAAISMLLVSSLMMVTSTYAWFTLSTAPEVTGITTAVGANGNLEMALLNPDLQDTTTHALIANWGDEIESGTSDSMDAANQLISDANITWGNLVDLSDTNTYGLNNITLYPSQLATTVVDGKTTINANPLSRPVFGADGRVAELKADTLTASYASNTFSNENAFGVRAVGTSSSMTARELAHRAALSSASTASTNAKSAASSSLKTNGNVLAGMAITHVGDADANFTYEQVNTLKTVIEALATSHTHIEDAMKWYVVAHNIAPDTVNDSTYLAIQDKIKGMELSAISTDGSISIPSNFDEVYSALTTSKGKVSTALSALPTMTEGKNDYKWEDFSDALNAIMDYNSMKLNGLAMDKVKEKDGAGNFVNASVIINAMGKEGLQLQMGSGSGVFADIADFCGTYSATIVFPEGTTVMGVGIGGVEATMTTNAPVNPTYLAAMRTNTEPFAAAAGGESTKSITDFYGYIVDLAFRTNAAGSNLLLQADAIDRIYGEEGKNEDTMGGGSTMTFTASEEFGVPSVQALMGNLRIVFFDTDTNVIIGEARLDAASATIEGNAVTMKMAMWDAAAATPAFKTGDDAKVITELAQNEAKAISVLVYLDGESVTNADVATSGSASMTGSMNLQFASSATLVPMEYTDLKDGKSSAESSQTIDLTAVTVDTAAAAAGISVTKAVGTSGTGFGVILSGVPADSVVTASVNGGATITGTPGAVSGLSGYAFAYTETLAADTPIVITVTEAPASGT